mgnify:FL=1
MVTNEQIKAATEMLEQTKDFITLGKAQSKLTQTTNKDIVEKAINDTTSKILKNTNIISQQNEVK